MQSVIAIRIWFSYAGVVNLSMKMNHQTSTATLIDAHVSIVAEGLELVAQKNELNTDWRHLIIEQNKKLLVSSASLSKLKSMQVINAFEELPLIPILLDTELQKAFVADTRRFNKALTLWLKVMLLNQPSPDAPPEFPPDIPHLVIEASYVIAVLAKANFALAIETYSRSEVLKQLFPSAKILWICCEFSTRLGLYRECGLLGSPVIRSKRRIDDYTNEFVKNLEEAETDGIKKQVEIAQKNFSIVDRRENLADLLFNEAATLYRTNSEFYDIGIYSEYWRIVRWSKNIAKNSSLLQACYLLPDDTSFVTGQNKKIPKAYALPTWGKED